MVTQNKDILDAISSVTEKVCMMSDESLDEKLNYKESLPSSYFNNVKDNSDIHRESWANAIKYELNRRDEDAKVSNIRRYLLCMSSI